MLWALHHEKNDWKSGNMGYSRQIGKIGDRTIWVSFYLDTINGLRVLFWNATSQLVDYKMIEDYLEKHCNPMEHDSTRRAKCDADNFHSCLHYSRSDKMERIISKYEDKN